MDGLVFTAGIGHHSPVIRKLVCDRLAWLGVHIDDAANQANLPCIGAPNSAIEVRVVATDKEVMIARHTRSVIEGMATQSQ